MTTWSQGGTPPSSNWSEGTADPGSAWSECAPEPDSAWNLCEAIPPVLDPIVGEVEAGTTAFLSLTGENFDATAQVAVAGVGVTVDDVIFVDSHTLLVTVTAASSATLGAHSTTVTTDSGQSNAQGLTVFQEAPPVATPPGDLRIWLEADWGIDDASGAALTQWRDRSGYEHHMTPAIALGYVAPVFQASGFGGIANLPRVNFNDLHGIVSPALAAGMDLSSFAVIAVFRRDAGDANSAFVYIISDVIVLDVQDSAASSYLARWNTVGKTVLRESSYQQAAGWVSKAVRHVMRVAWDGLTHAGHKLFLEGVQSVLPTQINSIAAPMISGGPASVRLGFRDPILPQFNLQGDYAALAIISPKPSDADIASWEAYFTTKWLQAAAPGTAGHGPILVAASTIDGITVTVSNWIISGDPAADFGSNAGGRQIQVISFSQAIRKFEMTLIGAPSFPNARVAFGCDGLSPAGTIDGGVTGMAWTSVEGGVRKSMQYDAGFDTVVLENTLSNVAGSTLVKDARFWLVGEPL